MKTLVQFITEAQDTKYVILRKDTNTYTCYHGVFDKLYKTFRLTLQ